MTDDQKAKDFTLVFGGDIRTFKINPLAAETPFGIAHSAAAGDILAEHGLWREALKEIADDPTGLSVSQAEIAKQALDGTYEPLTQPEDK